MKHFLVMPDSKRFFFRLKIIEVDRRAVKIQLTQKMSQNYND